MNTFIKPSVTALTCALFVIGCSPDEGMPVEESLQQACLYRATEKVTEVERDREGASNIQGIGYIETSAVRLHEPDYRSLETLLQKNNHYATSKTPDGLAVYEYYGPAKHRKRCVLNQAEQSVSFTLIYW